LTFFFADALPKVLACHAATALFYLLQQTLISFRLG